MRIDVPPCFTVAAVNPLADVDGSAYVWPIRSNAVQAKSSYTLEVVASGCSPGTQRIEAVVQTTHSVTEARLAVDVAVP